MVGFIMDVDYPRVMCSRTDRLRILQSLIDHKRGTPLVDLLRVYDPTARATLSSVLSRVSSPTSSDVGENYACMTNVIVTVCDGACEERQRLVNVSVTLIADNTLVKSSEDSSSSGKDDMKMERRCLFMEVVVYPLR